MGTWKVSPTTSPAQNIYKTIQQIGLPKNFVATSKPKQFLVSFQKVASYPLTPKANIEALVLQGRMIIVREGRY